MGTQPDAVIAALNAFPPPIVLIAGGRGKDLSLDTLAVAVAERTAATVLIGESAPEMERLFGAAGAPTIERAASLAEAVERAAAIARRLRQAGAEQATVLLSPAAASFDMFVDYAERGRAFRDAVRAVTGGER
jgi:UDP-N-acetylmuramoylalanine--D-glutamate ligase